ncbi:hypothetical protein ACFSC6_12975 [Rufibacter sediminis]|uniref:Uncharacterized protein n=1 Tax=Rufibacter sediminis TaxID=2762756 RepID=A0ABR6VTY1_9BACT|nr:hypothetical protein [Rufibacter sediminis]MBC3540375.1 hypothetical protein [Rufibacter sediminis]
MKTLKSLILLLAVALGPKVQAQTAAYDLTNFLTRFKIFEAQHRPKVQDTMPVYQPKARESVALPNAMGKHQGFMVDPVTKLHHYPQLGKVFDPQTGYSISFDPKAEYRVDVKAGKVYKGETEVKPEKGQVPGGKA